MATITISAEEETFSSISNYFIDYYMNAANGDFVKLYLYLARLCSAGRPISVSDIADHLNCTEKDVCRGIKYWIRQDVLKLSYNQEGEVNGIVICSLSKPERLSDENSLEEALSLEGGLHKKEAAAPAEDSPVDEPSGKEAPKKTAPTPDKINSVLADTQFCNLKSEARAYCDRELTKKDIDSLIYIYDNLKLSFDLIEYLLEYCASIKKTNFSYIEKVAINWYNNEITTRNEAEAFTAMYYSLYTKILKELGITSRMPAPVERRFIDHWTRELGFTEPIILEACRRAITSKPNSVTFNYVNGILESWYNSNVRSFADINTLDDNHRRSRSEKKASTRSSGGSQLNSSSSDLRDIEQLYLDEVRTNS